MSNQQYQKLEKLLEEIEKIDLKKIKKIKLSTAKIYKRNLVKFTIVMIENNINYNGINNIKTEHIKKFAGIELSKNRDKKLIISDLKGVYFFHNYAHKHTVKFRRRNLLDIKIIKRMIEEGEINYEKN